MRKLGTGMTNYFNIKYQESGRLFQGAYKARTVNNDEYLKYLSVYIQVKNLFEIYPKGFKKALQEFDKAFDWAVQYPFSSLSVYNLNKANNTSSIITKDILSEIFPNTHGYKEFSKDCIVDIENRLKDLF